MNGIAKCKCPQISVIYETMNIFQYSLVNNAVILTLNIICGRFPSSLYNPYMGENIYVSRETFTLP